MSSLPKRLALIAAACLPPLLAFARSPMDVPTLGEMLEKSDLVCVVQVRSVDAAPKPHPQNSWPDTIKSYMATCSLVCVFKGEVATNEITISFYGHLFDEPEPRANAPLVETHQRAHETIQYLVFLKRDADGRVSPVTGDLDPGLSFRVLLESFDGAAYDILQRRKRGHNQAVEATQPRPEVSDDQ
jgi:hypothetical protein